jgi:hypothetical protein
VEVQLLEAEMWEVAVVAQVRVRGAEMRWGWEERGWG